jgi:pimeloyl-ACP methyl ester carboxylesterase
MPATSARDHGRHPAARHRGGVVTGLATGVPAWKSVPSWFVFGGDDLNIPVALHRFMAERAGAKTGREVRGGSHALSVSQPAAVSETILDAIAA